MTAAYDGYGRLVGYDRSGAAAQAYVYNGLDDRVTMAAPGAARHFVYDSAGRVLGEYGASAADVKAEFIWAVPQAANDGGPFGGADGVGGYAPLAVATPDAGGVVQINWVHGNHLGVPLVNSDSAGAAVATPNDYLLPGFPGQSQVFADLYYNRYRDYDSATGRYIQADPIGLEGGSNPYLYANGNPINVTDPDGLAPSGGGPYHPPKGVGLRCYNSDSCPVLKGKMQLLMRMINSHQGWDRHNARPRGGNRHAVEIAGLWRAYANCQEISRRKKCDGDGCDYPGGKCEKVSVPVKKITAAGVAIVGLYVVYRCVRMVPSLFPPLWPTIPVNAAVP